MDLRELTELVVLGDALHSEKWTRRALDGGADPGAIVDEGLMPAMAIVGSRFSAGEIYVPEMLMAAMAMKSCLALLRPLIVQQGKDASRGRIVIGTVLGDIHDIGKNLVAMMLEGAGFEVHDLGVDVSPEAFVDAVRVHRPDIVGLSAMLTTTMPRMKDVIDALDQAGIRSSVKVIVGGAPVTQEFAERILADGYAADAGAAAPVASALVAGRPA